MSYEWVDVFTASDPMEAELIKGLLEGNGIPVIIEARGPQSMPFILGQRVVGGDLLVRVPPDREYLALLILSAKVDEEEPDPDAAEPEGDAEGQKPQR